MHLILLAWHSDISMEISVAHLYSSVNECIQEYGDKVQYMNYECKIIYKNYLKPFFTYFKQH